MQKYDKEQQNKRINEYKKLTKQSLPYFGIFGAVSHPFFSMSMFSQQESNPCNLDLRMCGKLIQEIKC